MGGEGRRVWGGTEGMGSDGGYGEGWRVWGGTEGMGREGGYGERRREEKEEWGIFDIFCKNFVKEEK